MERMRQFSLKRKARIDRNYLFFSLFHTLPDLGLPRGIILDFSRTSWAVVAAMLFVVSTEPAFQVAEIHQKLRHLPV